jgi:hypothetical protein
MVAKKERDDMAGQVSRKKSEGQVREKSEGLVKENLPSNRILYKTTAQKITERQPNQANEMTASFNAGSNAATVQAANAVNENIIPGHDIASMTAKEQYDTASRRLKTLEQQELSLLGRIDQMDPKEYARQMINLDVQLKQMEALRNLSARDLYNERESTYLDTVKNSVVGSAYQSGQDAARDQQVVLRLVAPNAANQPRYQADAAEIATKYGVNPESKTYQQDLMDLYQQLEQAVKQSNQEVETGAFDPERARKYELRLAKEEESELTRANTKEFAQEHPILSSALVLAASPLQGVDYLTQTARSIGHNNITDLDTYIPLSTADMTATNFAQDVRDAVSGLIEDKTTLTVLDRNLGEFLYSMGMSTAQTLAATTLAGAGAIYLMGMSTAASNMQAAIENGASNEQTIAYGFLSGTAEVILNKIGPGNLLKLSRGGNATNKLKQIARDVFQQVGIEATNAGVTEVADILSQAATLRDLSDTSIAVRSYMAQGMSKQEAQKQVLLDSVKQVGWAALENSINIGETVKRLRRHGAGVSGQQKQQGYPTRSWQQEQGLTLGSRFDTQTK